MEILSVPNLTTKELQTFTTECVSLCKPVVLLASSIQKVEDTQTTYEEAMLKEKYTSVSKKDLDYTRDTYLSGMYQTIKCERIFPHEAEETVAAISDLWEIVSKHGMGIRKLTYNEETAAIDNLFKDINSMDSLASVSDSISKWFTIVQQANEDFKTAAKVFINESTAISDQDAASTVAPLLRSSLQDLLLDLYSYTRVEQSDELITVYAKVATLVGSYN